MAPFKQKTSLLLPRDELTLRIEMIARGHVRPLPLNYYDSANWLWQTNDSIFKLARFRSSQNIFWEGAAAVFGLDRYRLARYLTRIPDQLPVSLPMPAIPMRWIGYIDGAPLWQQPLVSGQPLTWTHDTAVRIGVMCRQLQCRRATRFGHYLRPAYSLSCWASRLYAFLLPKLDRFPENKRLAIRQSLMQLPAVTSTVPLLLDLRQDQFLTDAIHYSWVDWEAMVWAPIEFAWALYEVLLPAKYRQAFMAGIFGAQRPVLKQHRMSARALLYVMGVLGHTDWRQMDVIDHWLDE